MRNPSLMYVVDPLPHPFSCTQSSFQGREIVLALGANKHGAWVGDTLAKVVEWQLEHPQGTRDDCLLWLEHEHMSGNLRFEDDSEPVSKRARTK